MSFAWQWERKKHFWIFDYIFALYSCGCVSKWCDKREFSFPFFNLMSKLNFTISHQKDRNVDDERKAFKSYFSFWKCHEIIVHGKRRECSNWDVVEKKMVYQHSHEGFLVNLAAHFTSIVLKYLSNHTLCNFLKLFNEILGLHK